MQWILFLLILMGQCSLFTCQLYEYHFVRKEQTWYEAQNYCRDHHTDLATLFDMKDVSRLRGSARGQDEEAWIGLRRNPDNNSPWQWSLPGVEFKNQAKWSSGQPNQQTNNNEFCVYMRNYKWHDYPCDDPHRFICYDATKSSDKFHLINKSMSWLDAQSYCRQNHTDLVSGLNQLEDSDLTRKINQSQKNWIIGLFRDKWKWSDGSKFSFRNWKDIQSDNDKCAMTKLNNQDKWESDDCYAKKSFFCYDGEFSTANSPAIWLMLFMTLCVIFFCYDDKVILIKENKTWDEALYYCREHYRDLASITYRRQQRWIQEKAKNASTPFVWLGLRYTCTLDLWFWVNNAAASYKNWASNTTNDDCDMSGAMERGGQHEWVKKNDAEKFNFICFK